MNHLSSIYNKDYIKAGIGIIIFGTGVNFLQKFFYFVWKIIKNKITISVELTSKDESYNWMIEWLSEHPYSKYASRLYLSIL